MVRKGRMRRSIRSEGNCCGKPPANPCVSGKNGRKMIVVCYNSGYNSNTLGAIGSSVLVGIMGTCEDARQ